MHDDLIETLREAQRFGFFGARPIEQSIDHSMQFVHALGDLTPGSRLIDIGSGGGLPGLVLADCYPTVEIFLLDRREKRTDFLRRAVGRLGWSHVTVIAADVGDEITSVESGRSAAFDVVTARGFGPPEVTVRAARRLIGCEGRIVISDPPVEERWPTGLVAELSLCRERHGGVSVFRSPDSPGPGGCST